MSARRGLGARWRRRRPLRTRLALAAAAAVALVAIGVCAAAFLVIRFKLYQQLDQNLAQSATLTVQQHRDEGPGVRAGECRFLGAPACAQIVPADSADDPAAPYLLPVAGATREVAAGRRDPYYANIPLPGGKPGRMFTTTFGDGEAVQVALRADIAERGVRQAALLLVAVGGAGIALSAAGGYWVSRTGLAPITRLTATAERIAATRDARHRIELPPGRPVREGREDEVTRLAATFNTMLAELEESVAARRRLVADASHELRTPLTALRTNAELLAKADRLTPAQRERAAGALGRQLREVTGLVNDLIELAREEEPQPLLEEVPLAPLATHAVDAARGHWPAVPFTLRIAPEAANLSVPGVPARLSRLLTNLLDNAAKFSPPGAPVELCLTATELTVRDYGPGIAEEDLPHVFDRFYRAEKARALPGSGLGLAMARQIAHAHGAELTAERAPGGGALFRLALPAS
ncbi:MULTISPECIES: sensor histidine kinase [Streptomyces]|uniref:sensor histidine kinase n=1 Tax=Streptomyces TaxID=1883 RepID=UPI001E4254C8|nr:MULTISPECIES: HAMP domain-containing sensor histidine kinase [Streptomyces]UFQ18121.1 HAMP domain-containing histidine kinase [Streptomyces huasconensis]WCL87732.1 HAMP domain-containing sensor histidine kinase [Streptomyces sp. JCM 35825]